MKASEWKYMGEGGKHAVFSYIGTASDYNGRVLRLCKDQLRLSSVVVEASLASRNNEPERTKKQEKVEDAQSYLRNVVEPLLRPYVDLPQVIHLEWDFVAALRLQTLVEFAAAAGAGNRLEHLRVQDWQPEREHDKADSSSSKSIARLSVSRHVSAYLLPNYRTPQAQDRDTGHDDQVHDSTAPDASQDPPLYWYFSCEIKPKAGYLTSSLLVRPALRRAKFHWTRFEIYQDLRQRGHLPPAPWQQANSEFPTSRYHPLDLYSNRVARIRTALQALVESPQNNFKVWRRTHSHVHVERFDQSRAPPKEEDHAMVELLACILAGESLLARLLSLQRLDVIDGDGAILLYHRLQHIWRERNDLIKHDRDETSQSVDEYLDTCLSLRANMPDASGDISLLPDSPFQAPSDCAALRDLLDELKVGEDLVEEDDFTWNQARARALQHVDALSCEECRFLLQNWLLSLAMCDASIFCRLRPIDKDNLRQQFAAKQHVEFRIDQAMRSDHTTRKGLTIVRKQDDNTPGVIAWNRQTGAEQRSSSTSFWMYELKLIDCDQKPARKLKTRHKKEDPIGFFLVDKEMQGGS